MSFKSLGLSNNILRAIQDQGYTKATPIQEQSIPLILKKNDILAAAQTGTGKTAGFTLPLLQLLSESTNKKVKHHPRALILTPTRELAAQVADSVKMYGKFLPFKSTVIFGGVSSKPQINAIRSGVDIIIATPGRLLDLLEQKILNLSSIEMLILDEADRMLDMGFIHDIKKVVALMPRERQTLLFSATFSPEIKELSKKFLRNPKLVEVARQNSTSTQVTQAVYPVDRERKRELLSHLISTQNWMQVLVFTRTKHGADRLTRQLIKDEITAAAIHGNKSQNARTRALDNFKKGEIRVLVATDIAARGIDIDKLEHVVNFELPNIAEDYVHRIGRTGRAGNTGGAISLVCVDEHEYLRGIEKLIKKNIEKRVIKGFEVDPSIKAEPIRQKSGNRNHSNSRTRNNSNAKQEATSRPKKRSSSDGSRSNADRRRGRNTNKNRTKES